MTTEEYTKTEASLNRLKKSAKAIRVFFKVIFVLFCIVWVMLVALFGFLSFFPEIVSPDAESAGAVPFILCIVFGLLIAVFLRQAIHFLSDIEKGESPFSMRQVRRIRVVALIFMVYVVVEAVFSIGQTTLVESGSLMVKYSVTSVNSNPTLSINFGMLSAAAILYCLSLVFEYGTLLQQLSDETL